MGHGRQVFVLVQVFHSTVVQVPGSAGCRTSSTNGYLVLVLVLGSCTNNSRITANRSSQDSAKSFRATDSRVAGCPHVPSSKLLLTLWGSTTSTSTVPPRYEGRLSAIVGESICFAQSSTSQGAFCYGTAHRSYPRPTVRPNKKKCSSE